MTCAISGTGQTNILALCYLFGKTYKPARSSATQATEINPLDQITGKVIDASCTYIPLKALMTPLKRVKLRGVVSVSEPVFKPQFIVPQRSPQKRWSWVFNSNTS